MRLYSDNFVKCLSSNEEACYYFLGLWMTDGSWRAKSNKNITLQVTLQQCDSETLQELSRVLFGSKRTHVSEGQATLQVSSVATAHWIHKKTRIPIGAAKSSRCRMPNATRQQMQYFLRGVFDGDGSFIARPNGGYAHYELCSIDKEFLSAIMRYLTSRGIHTRWKKPSHRLGDTIRVPGGRTSIVQNEVWGLSTCRIADACRLYELLYPKKPSHSIARKYAAANNYYTNTVPKLVAKTQLTDAQINQAYKKYAAGASLRTIAKRLGKCRDALLSNFRRRGLPQVVNPHKPKLSVPQINDLVSDYASGVRDRALVRKYGVCKSTVLKYVKRAGVFCPRTTSRCNA